jgi:hypothetical protein
LNTEFLNTKPNSYPTNSPRKPAPPRSSRRHPSPEMRRQVEIAYAAALEVLG